MLGDGSESTEGVKMGKRQETDLAQGMTPSEFAKEADPATWQIYDSGIRHFIEACGGVFSTSGSTAAQQEYQRQYISAQRELVRVGIARLTSEPHHVSGVMQGAANRVLIDPDLVLSLTIWDLRLNKLFAPHGRIFDHVRIQPLRATASARGRKSTYDWVGLKAPLADKTERTDFKTVAQLVEWCTEKVVLRKTGKKPSEPPNDATVRDAISKHGLDKIAGIDPRRLMQFPELSDFTGPRITQTISPSQMEMIRGPTPEYLRAG